MARAPRIATALAVVAMAAAGVGAQCQGDPTVSFEVDMPASVAATAQWLEVGVLPGSCPAPGALAGGLPVTGVIARVAFEKGNTSPPPVGALKKGAYAFAAIARDARCGVVGTGCADVDVTDARDVSITLAGAMGEIGACTGGATCFDARCVPAVSAEAGQGAGCPMALVGAGPLGNPMTQPETASAPAVVVTERGFLVAYREYDSAAGNAAVTAVAVSTGGALTLGKSVALPSQCAGQDESDGVGLGYADGSGTLVSARPTCGTQPAGFDALAVDASGAFGAAAFSTAPGGSKPGLSNAHAFVATGAGAGLLAYLEKGQPTLASMSSLLLQGTPAAFGGVTGATLAQIATSGTAGAMLAAGASGGDSGAPNTLSVTLGNPGASGGMPTDFPGTWGSVAMLGVRAIVLSDSTATGQPLAWRAFDPPPAAPTTATFAPQGQGTVTGGDVAATGDLAFFASERTAGIGLDVFAHASTTPASLRSIALSSDPRLPSLASVRDGKLAVAATSTQVLVAWVTGTTLGTNDAVGGWALYACAP